MPKGNHIPNHPSKWKKGQSGNPRGLAKDSIAKKELKEFTAKTVADAYAKMCMQSKREVTRLVKTGKIPIIEHIIGKCLLMDAKKSNTHNLDRILERIIGPVPVLTGSLGQAAPGNLSSFKDEELNAIIVGCLKAGQGAGGPGAG